MSKELDFEKDNTIAVDNLSKEFRNFPPTLFRYCEIVAEAEEAYGLAKAVYKETQSEKYIELKSKEGKITEANLSAMVEVDPDVKKALRNMLSCKKDLETLQGYVESMRAKKDMLIQLGADARKE